MDPWMFECVLLHFYSTFVEKWKYQKTSIKKIDKNVECENIGYRNSQRIYDEREWGHKTVFFFDIFPFHTTWINPNHLN